MNVLITGGTGMIGGRLVSALLASTNHRLFLTTRRREKLKNKYTSQVKLIQWDALSQDFPKDELPESLDGVII